jgi:glutathione S-transferase
MKLYYAPGACSLAPHIAAREAGLDLELEKVDLGRKKTASGEDYLALNPKGYVPALRLEDGSLLTEAAAVLQYLGDRAPAAGLLPPAGAPERYRVIEWLYFIATELHKAFAPLWNPKAQDEAKAAARSRIVQRLALVEKALERGDYLLGDRFTAADAYLFTIVGWTAHTGVDISGFPRLQAFQERIAARPAVRAAMKAEGLLK